MKAGLLTEVINIQRPVVRETRYSGNEVEYEDYITTRANVIHDSGRRGILANEITYSYTVRFIIRYYHQVTADMIIVHNGVKYNITDINPEKRKQSITITAEVWNE